MLYFDRIEIFWIQGSKRCLNLGSKKCWVVLVQGTQLMYELYLSCMSKTNWNTAYIEL